MTDLLPQNTSDQTTPPPPSPASTLLIKKTEEEIYEMAFAELQNNAQRLGLWSKALSESLGDNPKAQAIYIRLRAEQLIAEQGAQHQIKIEAEKTTLINFNCPSCGRQLQLTKGQLADTAALKYPNWIRRCSVCNAGFDCRSVIPEQYFRLKTPCRFCRIPVIFCRHLHLPAMTNGQAEQCSAWYWYQSLCPSLASSSA